MAGARAFVALLAAALLLAQAVLGSEEHQRLLGAPVDVAENDEGLQRALQFAMAQYNRANNDMYSSRVVRIISAQRQVGAGGVQPWQPAGDSPTGGSGAPDPFVVLAGSSSCCVNSSCFATEVGLKKKKSRVLRLLRLNA